MNEAVKRASTDESRQMEITIKRSHRTKKRKTWRRRAAILSTLATAITLYLTINVTVGSRATAPRHTSSPKSSAAAVIYAGGTPATAPAGSKTGKGSRRRHSLNRAIVAKTPGPVVPRPSGSNFATPTPLPAGASVPPSSPAPTRPVPTGSLSPKPRVAQNQPSSPLPDLMTNILSPIANLTGTP